MRRVALGCMAVMAGLAIAGTTATALSTHAPEQFDQTLTLAGGPDAAHASAQVDDPDAPIATARYGGEHARSVEAYATPAAASVALAGAPPTEIALAGGPAPAPTALAAATPPKVAPVRTAEAPVATRALAEAPASSHRPVLALTHDVPHRPYGKTMKLEVNDQPLPFTPMGLQSNAVRRLTLSAANFMSKATTSASDLQRGRWMLFAASSGKAYGVSLIRDTFGGWRNAGVSEEKLARFGSRQVGVGWRKHNSLISLTATQRKFRNLDYSDKDTVVGMTVSVRGR